MRLGELEVTTDIKLTTSTRAVKMKTTHSQI
jgi:hypothetical protein